MRNLPTLNLRLFLQKSSIAQQKLQKINYQKQKLEQFEISIEIALTKNRSQLPSPADTSSSKHKRIAGLPTKQFLALFSLFSFSQFQLSDVT